MQVAADTDRILHNPDDDGIAGAFNEDPTDDGMSEPFGDDDLSDARDDSNVLAIYHPGNRGGLGGGPEVSSGHSGLRAPLLPLVTSPIVVHLVNSIVEMAKDRGGLVFLLGCGLLSIRGAGWARGRMPRFL